MIGRLLSLFGAKPRVDKGRLTSAQACAIAAEAAGDTHWRELMTMATLEDSAGGPVWRVGSATVGSGLTVEIDDATGAVLKVEPWGVR